MRLVQIIKGVSVGREEEEWGKTSKKKWRAWYENQECGILEIKWGSAQVGETHKLCQILIDQGTWWLRTDCRVWHHRCSWQGKFQWTDWSKSLTGVDLQENERWGTGESDYRKLIYGILSHWGSKWCGRGWQEKWRVKKKIMVMFIELSIKLLNLWLYKLMD